jgi:predicted enzyme related to lactoylglutathione lyase
VAEPAAARRTTRFYFMIHVREMRRAVDFYVGALGAELRHFSEELSEVHAGDVTVCLRAGATDRQRGTGMMMQVHDLPATCDAIRAAGGDLLSPVGPGLDDVESVEAIDTEGNVFTVMPAAAHP